MSVFAFAYAFLRATSSQQEAKSHSNDQEAKEAIAMDRLQSMRVFQQVVEQGGFSAAARKLDLAPTAVTRLVSNLEEHLGVRLLHRTTRRLSVTPAGEVYLQRLRAILSDISNAEIEVKTEAHAIDGVVRVLAPSAAASRMLAAAAAAFQRLHPEVSVEIDVLESAEPPVHAYDLAVVSGDARIDLDFICRPLVHSEYVFCASPDYLARHGEPRTPHELRDHRFLRLRNPGAQPGALDLSQSGQARVSLELPAVMQSNDLETLLRATLDDGGISAQPVDLVAHLFEADRLRRVLSPWIAGHLTLMAVLASRKFVPSRTRAFLDHLVAHLASRRGSQWAAMPALAQAADLGLRAR